MTCKLLIFNDAKMFEHRHLDFFDSLSRSPLSHSRKSQSLNDAGFLMFGSEIRMQ